MTKQAKQLKDGVDAAKKAAGGPSKLADLLGINKASVSGWHAVPPARVLVIEKKTGVSRSVLRPDLYPSAEA